MTVTKKIEQIKMRETLYNCLAAVSHELGMTPEEYLASFYQTVADQGDLPFEKTTSEEYAQAMLQEIGLGLSQPVEELKTPDDFEQWFGDEEY